MASRLIVKNLPRHLTEERLREHFAALGELTDCRLKLTKEGRSRQFAFIGFRREEDAKSAVDRLHSSFLDTSRISVEPAHEPGSEALSRPWSRHTAGSSAHARSGGGRGRQAKGDAAPENSTADAGGAGARERGPLGSPKVPKVLGARGVKTAGVAPRKAGVASRRVHVEFASSGEEEEGAAEGVGGAGDAEGAVARAGENPEAFDDSLSDLAYLRAKVDAAAPVQEELTKDSSGGKKTRRKKRGSQAEKGLPDGPEGEELAGELVGKLDTKDNQAPLPGSSGPTETASLPEEGTAAAARDLEGGSGELNELEDLGSTGRLYVTNIPYGATEDELRVHFEGQGEVSSASICRDEDTLKPRGFGYVTYVFPECAVRALSETRLRSFQGRLLGVTAARTRPVAEATPGATSSGTSSYKRKRKEKQRKVEAHLEHTWNLLYVSANAATDAASAQLGMAKSELVGKDADNAAVTAALTETSIVQQTKRWLQREGIRVEAFEQSGANLAQSRAAEGKRRDDAFVVKHLPAGASAQELRERFARHGELVRCALAPSGTVAVVQYAEASHAARAFSKLAFARYRGAPLYLEWAPGDVFLAGSEAPTAAAEGVAAPAAQAGRATGPAAGPADEGEGEGPGTGCLFAKNLSFSTTDEALAAAFRGCRGFRSAVVMRKLAPVSARGEAKAKGQSMGYGFVEFDTAASALETLKKKQGTVLDGHAVQLQVSQRRAEQRKSKSEVTKAKAGKALSSQRLCVRNLAFEATAKELRQLFGAYGSLTSVRIPKKGDYTGHRGFAFLDFASKSDAAAAYEALQHTHLYGRRMVIEPAEEKPNDVGAAQLTAERRQAAREGASEAKRRKKAGVFNAPADAVSFEEAMS